MVRGDETLPLTGNTGRARHNAQPAALGSTAAYLMILAVLSFPPFLDMWHDLYFTSLDVEARGWTWLGANALWLALALLWTLFHLDNGPCAATACILCSFFWVYMDVILVSQAIRGQLPTFAVVDFAIDTALLVLCVRAAWGGVASPSQKTRSDGSSTWKRVFRKWVLVVASLQLLAAFWACWPIGFALTSRVSKRESAPWEWNSGVLLIMALAVLWAAFLTRGGLVDETKRAACTWCALVFSGGFALCSSSWPSLGMDGCSLATSIVLAFDVCVLIVAAAI